MASFKCTIAVLPTLHALHKLSEFSHYNYQVLERTVLGFAPDVVCGEVRLEDWLATNRGLKEGYCGPPEYRECLLPLCSKHGIPFEPIDFYDKTIRELTKKQTDINPHPDEEQVWQQITRLMKRSNLGLAAFLDPKLLDLLREKHRLAQRYHAEIEALTWDPRNLRILANILAVCARYLEKRVLVTIGLEHLAAFTDHLSLCPMLRLTLP